MTNDARQDPPQAVLPTTVIGPASRLPLPQFREIWAFRDLFVRFAERDLKLRYRQTALGVTWVVLQPLLAAGIFTFVFGQIAGLKSDGSPYFAFAYVGMLSWNVFAQCLARVSGSLVGNAHLISKVFFPRLILPLSSLGSILVDLLVALAMGLVIIVISGVKPGLAVLALPVWLLLAAMLGTGAGLVGAALMVSYRDVGQILPVATQLLLYATPVAYGLDAVPEKYVGFVQLNPLAVVVEGTRWSLLGGGSVGAAQAAWAVATGVGFLVLGVMIFTSMERRFADVI